MTLTLNDEQLKKLDSILGEIPSKHAMPIIMLLNTIAQEQQKREAELVNANTSGLGGKGISELKAVPLEN